MPKTDHELNLAVTFSPMGDDLTLPCMEIGGIQVYAYFVGPQLRIGVDYDTAEPDVLTEDGTVPTRVTLGDTEVYTAP